MSPDFSLTQLTYIVALDDERNFIRAAEKCFVSQPALTMQVKKMEESLGAEIFNRGKKPLVPTEIGSKIIAHARYVLQEASKIEEIVAEFKGEVKGNLTVGIIPTVAPYLMSLFIHKFVNKYREAHLQIVEMMTDDILRELERGELDAGIIVTPYSEANRFRIIPLYYEKFYAFIAPQHPLYGKEKINLYELDVEELWLLTEGNCFRNQVLNVCRSGASPTSASFSYISSSLEALKKIVLWEKGITILPELALEKGNPDFMKSIRGFEPFTPVREVSLVVSRAFLKQFYVEKVKDEIIAVMPREMLAPEGELVAVDKIDTL
jgi:LysR family hydrogen peroxide-inducible transcriptional activator